MESAFSLIDMLEPPNALTESGVSPRAESLTWVSAGQTVFDSMLQAGARAASSIFQRTPIGQQIAAETRQQEIWKFLQSPAGLLGVGLLLTLLVMAFAGRR